MTHTIILSFAIPGPVSVTSTLETFTTTDPPFGVNLRALEIRLRKTSESLCSSARIIIPFRAFSDSSSTDKCNFTLACRACNHNLHVKYYIRFLSIRNNDFTKVKLVFTSLSNGFVVIFILM